jgi:enoyl-CoA hydratase/carnithine racemase
MLLTGEPVCADQLYGTADVVPVPKHAKSTDTTKAAFEKRIEEVVQRLVSLPPQPQALGKSAYWAKLEMLLARAAYSAKKAMKVHIANKDGKEGISAFLEKRSPSWTT